MDSILRQLIAAGVQSVALLAIGGQGFFTRFGFIKVGASGPAPDLLATGHFQGADPTLASPMVLDLRGATLVRPARREDMPAVLAIYNDAVAQSTATYDYEPRTLEDQFAQYDQKMLDGYCFYVALTPDGTVAGFSTYGLYRTAPRLALRLRAFGLRGCALARPPRRPEPAVADHAPCAQARLPHHGRRG